MLYSIVGVDVDNSLPLRKTARPAHLQRLQELQAEGRLRRAAVIDCDVHQGNGTAAIVNHDPTIFYKLFNCKTER